MNFIRGFYQMTSEIILEQDFKDFIGRRGRRLLSCAKYLSKCKTGNGVITRPLLGDLLSQSAQVEELLDEYCAGINCQWCGFRSLTAAIKGFSDISYELLHIRSVLPGYNLLPIGRDFVEATNNILQFTTEILIKAVQQILIKAEQLGVHFDEEELTEQSFLEALPDGIVTFTCEGRKIEIVPETISMLATAFLNLAADSKDICSAGRAKQQEYTHYLSDSVSEEKLRSLQLRFHNLQSLYDTFISGTEAAAVDKGLPVLRGHISIVLHLLRIATLLTHHYERHINKRPCSSPSRLAPLMETETLLAALMDYAITYISLYIDSAVHLCQQMLKQYAEVGQIELPIPQYRGFHVRPSTLIAKIVQHYGSEVKMHINNEVYDARTPFDLFRANEKINAQKRLWLKNEIVNLKLVNEQTGQLDIEEIVLSVALTLAGRAKIIMYEQPLQLPQKQIREDGTLIEKVVDEIATLLALGKIDVDIHITAIFAGDKRVLNDIRLLAESGYGEDKFGNNVPLPNKLSYLRQ
jgi:hypothetical protein